jgi:hypothetical protein
MDKSMSMKIAIVVLGVCLALFDIVLKIVVLVLMNQSYHKWSCSTTAAFDSKLPALLAEYNCSQKYNIQGEKIYLSTCANNTDIVDLREWENTSTPTAAGVTLTVSSFEDMCAHSVRQYFNR